MATKEPGYIYILTNPSFREDWVKIGKSSRPVDVRSKELVNEGTEDMMSSVSISKEILQCFFIGGVSLGVRNEDE